MAISTPAEQPEELKTLNSQPLVRPAEESATADRLPDWHRREERIFFGFLLGALVVFAFMAVALWRALVG